MKCPNDCHQIARWSEPLETFVQDEVCDNCGSKMVAAEEAAEAEKA